jgi:hypothetical protein
MDHLAVSAAGFLAGAGVFFHDQHVIVLCGKCLRDGRSDDPGADQRYIKALY